MAHGQSDWPFDAPPNLACITTVKVLREGHPILLVTHDKDDDGWQFLCGTTNDPKDGLVVGLDCIYQLDPSVGEVANLPPGWIATRDTRDVAWHLEKNPWHDEEDE